MTVDSITEYSVESISSVAKKDNALLEDRSHPSPISISVTVNHMRNSITKSNIKCF